MNNNTDQIRHVLHQIERVAHVEMANVSLAQAWPLISHLVEAMTFTDPARRGDAIERFTCDLTRCLGETRRTINRCNERIADEERREASGRLRAVGGE
jgi:hypothetical protein